MRSKAIGKAASRGASIIELLAVVGLIGVCSAVAVSTMQPYGDQYRVKGAAVLVAGELARARQEAVRTRLCHFFVPGGTNGFSIARDAAANPNCQYETGDTLVSSVSLSKDFKGVSFSSGGASSDPYGAAIEGPTPSNVRFEPRGSATTAGGSAVFLRGTSYGPMAVTVTAAGTVRTWRLDGGTWR